MGELVRNYINDNSYNNYHSNDNNSNYNNNSNNDKRKKTIKKIRNTIIMIIIIMIIIIMIIIMINHNNNNRSKNENNKNSPFCKHIVESLCMVCVTVHSIREEYIVHRMFPKIQKNQIINIKKAKKNTKKFADNIKNKNK